MAINKNFVVKNGIEVNENLIIADADQNKVGIGTTVLPHTFNVIGGIGATDITITGIATISNELRVGASGTVFTVIAGTAGTVSVGQSVGIGTSQPGYLLDVRSPVSTGQTALYVQGDARVTGDLFVDDIVFDEASINSLYVSGISTFAGTVEISSLTENRILIAGAGSVIEDDVNLTFDSSTLTVGANLGVTGVSTFGSLVDINADLDVDGRTELDTTNVAETLNVVGISTFESDIDINASVDISNDLVVNDSLNVVGLSTFGSAVDINSDLDVDGRTELDITNIAETLNVVGVSTFSSAVDINADLDVDGRTELDTTNISETLNVSGISTFVGVSTFQSGIINAGVTTSNAYTIDGTQVISSARELQNIASLDATTTATIESAIANAPNTFSDIEVTGLSTFVGFSTFGTSGVYISGITSVGTGITMYPTTGIVSATEFHGDGSNLTGFAPGLTAAVGVSSEGTAIGSGVTQFDFRTNANATLTVDSAVAGVATVTIAPSVSLSLVIALGGL